MADGGTGDGEDASLREMLGRPVRLGLRDGRVVYGVLMALDADGSVVVHNGVVEASGVGSEAASAAADVRRLGRAAIQGRHIESYHIYSGSLIDV
jgi:small nuclear ribonucleoprotein (snRNP)-like protein